jgi:hypothetical protein
VKDWVTGMLHTLKVTRRMQLQQRKERMKDQGKEKGPLQQPWRREERVMEEKRMAQLQRCLTPSLQPAQVMTEHPSLSSSFRSLLVLVHDRPLLRRLVCFHHT